MWKKINMVKDQDILQSVRDRDPGQLQKLLHRAAKSNKKLLGGSKRLNVNFQDEDGMSALHQASLMGNLAMMQMLLESGANPGLKDNKGMLALHYAAWQGKSEPVHALLQWKSPVNEQSQDGNTPLHLACQHGHFDVVNLILLHNGVPTIVNYENKTPLDLACEFGRYRVVDLLLRSNLCAPLLMDSPTDMFDEKRTTCLHLAAKNGHIEIIRLLLQGGVNINRSTLRGTCLHEAALCGKTEVVRLLLVCGVDVNKTNSYDQTALDIVTTYTTSRAAKDLKQLLKEASFAVQARAVKDYCNIYDPHTLAFKQGDIIKVIEQREDAWKGVVISDGRMAKPGYFPPDHVVLIDNPTNLPNHVIQGKRVPMPNVPDLLSRSPGFYPQPMGSMDHTFPPPPSVFSPKSPVRNGAEPSVFAYPGSPYHTHHSSFENVNGRIVNHNGETVGDWSGIPTSPVGDYRKGSPSNSNRNSAASSDSGRGYSTGHLEQSNHKHSHSYPNVQISNSNHRLSGQSYESGVSSRQSYHSTSSSSVGSLDRLEETGNISQINVAELFRAGMPDHEVLRAWLRDLRFEEYYECFIKAGYDMPTITHMTPQDLSAIGITKPGHRKRLKAEIVRLNIHDGIPDYKPNDVMEWLHRLGLEQYYNTLLQQGYDNIDYVTDIMWEDLEEIGISKLGHQKKIMLAIDRLKRITSGCKRLSTLDNRRGSSEILDPPPSYSTRWSGEEYAQELPQSPFKARKSSSGDSININNNSLDQRFSHHSDRLSHHSDGSSEFVPSSPIVAGYQPDLVAIQVKRHSSQSGSPKDMSGQPITYQSFQVPPSPKDKDDRDSTPTAEDNEISGSPVTVAPTVPKAVIKPKPVAKIIAKTKRSSRECSPDIIDVEKHETEKNLDASMIPKVNQTFSPNGSLTKKSMSQSDHIYDRPGMGSPKSHSPYHVPNVSMSQSVPDGQTNALYVSTQQDLTSQPQNSPKSRKVPPPPPPKRTNSISKDTNMSHFAGSIPKSALQHTYSNVQRNTASSHSANTGMSEMVTASNNSPKHTTSVSHADQDMAPKQQAFASCVQSLSERFGSKRKESANEDNFSSDGEEFPPPPPPIAMDIITPKIHNYGIPSKSDKQGSDYRIKPKTVPSSEPNHNNNTSSLPGAAFDVKLKKTFVSDVSQNSNPPISSSILPSKSHATAQFSNSKPHPSVNIQTTNTASALPTSTKPAVENLDIKRKDSTSSFDSTVSTSSVDSNTLPFANENVGTIKQRTPTTKPSIVPITENVELKNVITKMPTDSPRSFRPAVPQKPGASPVQKPGASPVQKGLKPAVPEKPKSPSPGKRKGDVLTDIDCMLQGLTEELDAMLEEEMELNHPQET